MRCLFNFKEKLKTREQKSAPVLKKGRKLDNSPVVRATKSSSLASASSSSPRGIPDLYEEKAQNLRVFTFSELRNATNNFSRLLKIGEGGFGSVYKGFVKPRDGSSEQIVVAIKKLNKDGLQGHKQWMAEVQFLGVLEHPNLVKLIGYCAVDGEIGIQRLLVYEFLSNKTLEDHLFSRALPVLPWKKRLEIVLGAAQGLVYLHDGLEVQVSSIRCYQLTNHRSLFDSASNWCCYTIRASVVLVLACISMLICLIFRLNIMFYGIYISLLSMMIQTIDLMGPTVDGC